MDDDVAYVVVPKLMAHWQSVDEHMIAEGFRTESPALTLGWLYCKKL